MDKPVILTGLRANNNLHIGNYLGALLPMVDMARQRAGEYQVNLFVPDLHSFTTPIDHSKLYEQVLNNIKVYVAAGLPIDHEDVYIYRQSYIPAHSELTWILDGFTGFGEMGRMTQFKDKMNFSPYELSVIDNEYDEIMRIIVNDPSVQEGSRALQKLFGDFRQTTSSKREETALYQSIFTRYRKKKEDRVSVGLFNYPVLMAADILLYNSSYVPVGDDQTQHLEFTRDIAERMNRQFGEELFTVPLPVAKQHEFFGKDQGLRIRDLADPTKKMSKSDDTGKGVIFLSDTPETARKKIMSATTDSYSQIKYDIKGRPGISNLLQILALLSGKSLQDAIAEHEGKTSYGELKTAVADVVADFLADFQKRLQAVDEAELQRKLTASETAMSQTANQTLLRAQKAVGLRPKQ